MTIEQQRYFYIGSSSIVGEYPTTQELKKQLEKGTEEEKIKAMKNLLVLMTNGDPCPEMLMYVIRFVMPTPKNKTIKTLLLLYFELCERVGADGKLKQEMILVCNALRNDLQHPNEYVRGAALRLVSKLKEQELLEPLIPSVRVCLEHRHAYVRKNAISTACTIYQDFPGLMPDVPDKLEELLGRESDVHCLRMTLLALARISRSLLVGYLYSQQLKLEVLEDTLQMAILETIQYDVSQYESSISAEERSLYLHIVATLSLVPHVSSSVKYLCASLFSTLSDLPATLKQALRTYIGLLTKESNNNVRLVVLDRIEELYRQHSTDYYGNTHGSASPLESSLVDLLGICSPSGSSSLAIIQKVLDILITFSTPSIVPAIVEQLRKGLEQSMDDVSEHIEEYRKVIISSITKLLVEPPSATKHNYSNELVSTVLGTISQFLTDKHVVYLQDCVHTFRSIAHAYRGSSIGDSASEILLEKLFSMKSARTFRACLWIIGEFSNSTDSVFNRVSEFLAIVSTDSETEAGVDPGIELNRDGSGAPHLSKQRILPDGTYASESAYISASSTTVSGAQNRKQLKHIFYENGNSYTLAAISMMLTKLVFRVFYQANLKQISKSNDIADQQSLIITSRPPHICAAQAMLYIVKMLKSLKASSFQERLCMDSLERASTCFHWLSSMDLLLQSCYNPPNGSFKLPLFISSGQAFEYAWKRKLDTLDERGVSGSNSSHLSSSKKAHATMPDTPISLEVFKISPSASISTYSSRKSLAASNLLKSLSDDIDVLGLIEASRKSSSTKTSRLDSVFQLSGPSDPIYAEAYIDMDGLDILLDIILVNQGQDTLRNLVLEFGSSSGYRAVFKPTQPTIGPFGFANIKAVVHVKSADQGLLQGCISYDAQAISLPSYQTLTAISLDICHFLKPSICTDSHFTESWRILEWENKIHIKSRSDSFITAITDLCSWTNFRCICPSEADLKQADNCDVFSANLFAKSKFGDDVLANISLERTLLTDLEPSQRQLVGHIRIRSKSNGLAFILGTKISKKMS
jgi:coatomer subunit beta